MGKHIVHTEVASVYAGSTAVLLSHLLLATPDKWQQSILFRHAEPRDDFRGRIPEKSSQSIRVLDELEANVLKGRNGAEDRIGQALYGGIKTSPTKKKSGRLKTIAGTIKYYLSTVLPEARNFSRWLEKIPVDLLQLHNGPLGNVQGILAAKYAGIPLTARLQSFMEPAPLDRIFLNRPLGYIAVAEAVKQYYVDRGIDAHRIRVIYEGLQEDEFEMAEGYETVKKELNIPEDHLLAGLVGRLVWWKGHDYFLEAAEITCRNHRNIHFVIVGGADPTEPEYEAHLYKKTRDLGISDRVHFTGYRSDARRYSAALDIAVLASCLPEPGGRSILEALAMGRPCIATHAGGMPEYIGDDESAGLLVPIRDSAAMAQAMERLITDRDAAERIGNCARERMYSKFHMRQTVAGIEEFWREILEKAGNVTG